MANIGGTIGGWLGGYIGGEVGTAAGAVAGTAIEPGGGTTAVGVIGGLAGSQIGRPIGTAIGTGVGQWLDNLMFSKGGKQNIRDTGLIGVSDEEIERRLRDPATSSEERKRLVKEQKGRRIRNKEKDSRKICK